MGGVVGRLFREFSLTLTFAIAISTVVSLSLTPMICAHFVQVGAEPERHLARPRRRADARSRGARPMRASLDVVLRHRVLTLLVFLATIALTVGLYVKTPKGFFPQDDTGLIFGGTRASPDISFEAMKELQQRATEIVLADPAVAYVGSSVGASAFNASVNNGRLFISLKPPSERGNVTLAAGHQPAAPQAPRRRRHAGVHVPGAGHSRRRPAVELVLSVHAVGPRPRRTAEARAARRRQGAEPAGAGRRHHRPRAGRPAGQCRDRPAGGVAARRAHPGHRQRAQQRLFAAADFHDLLGAQPVSRHPRGRSAVPARSLRPDAGLCRRQRQHAGAAVQRRADREDAGAAGHQPPGPVPGGDHHLQSGAERPDRGRFARDREGGRRASPAGYAAPRSSPATPRPISARSARSRW